MGRDVGTRVLGRDDLDALIALLGEHRRVLGPVELDGAISIGEISGVADLPAGIGDEQAPGRYRLGRRDDAALFGYAVGAASWRREVFPPATVLVRIRRPGTSRDTSGATTDGGSYDVDPPDPASGVLPAAWIGVRPCDLAALRITDRVFVGGEHPDPHYATRRSGVDGEAPVVVAVECHTPSASCACTSVGGSPAAPADGGGADLVLSELVGGPESVRFVCRPATPAGEQLLDRLAERQGGLPVAGEDDRAAASAATERAAAAMAVRFDGTTLPADLRRATADTPRWEEVASRCLACANCTLVCPTCFCSTVEDTTDLAGTEQVRTRVWDSCFTSGHSYLHGGSVHASTLSRYRQWLTHKLDTWWDQFGTSGCVGCGRCTTWCPAGIDLFAEAAALQTRESPS